MEKDCGRQRTWMVKENLVMYVSYRYGRINIRKLRDDNLVPAKMVKRESIAVTTDPCWPRRDPP